MQNNSLTIRQARLQGQEGLWQITIEDGRFSRIDPQETASAPVGQVLDAECGLVIPPFIEPHIHLDTTQTAGEPNWNQSGTLFEESSAGPNARRCLPTKTLKLARCRP